MNDIAVFAIKFVAIGFAVAMFAMNLAVVLTWVDRRQGAMIQDRVGPNRAVAWLPTKLAQAMAVGPALLLAASVIGYCFTHEVKGAAQEQRGMLFSQLAVLLIWLTGCVIASQVKARGPRSSFDLWIQTLGEPRYIFFGGLIAHLALFFASIALRGREAGVTLSSITSSAGPFLFAFTALAGAVYAAHAIRKLPRVGLRLAGLLHPAADGLKTLFKEDFIPPNADRFLFNLAPFISFFPALVVLACVPFADTLCFATDEKGKILLSQLASQVPSVGVCTEGALKIQVIDLNIGILYFFAIAGTGIVGAALAGWASDNKYSLLGGLRAASQMVSYEVTMGLTLIGMIMVYGTLQVDEMILWQQQNTWGVFAQPLAFILFFAAAVAESKRIPFDIPEGESEIVAGYFTEYAGMKFAMFFFAEYIAVVTASALMAAVFFGGWSLPFVLRDGIHFSIGGAALFDASLSHGAVVALGALGFIFKTIVLCWLQLTIRWTLPRFRYDQLMRLGWRKLLPASLANILLTGFVVMAIQSAGPVVWRAMDVLSNLCNLVIAAAGIGLLVWLAVFLSTPRKRKQNLSTTSAQYAAEVGGTRTARMGA
ncbi:MAG TPA: complex I subunit 1 family protein [Polyangiaceae bacterium]|nr:complex I subunit 1 family protein [Polyangiaceae bacterium]